MIVLFAGAGASSAVSTKKYPTTQAYFERLPQNIKNAVLFGSIVKDIKLEQKKDTVDIEEVLFHLEDLMLSIKVKPEGRRFNTNSSARDYARDLSNRILDNMGVSAPKMNELKRLINEQVYSLYKQLPSDAETKGNWKRLLSALKTKKHPLQLFTTNYDLIIERAYESLTGKNINLGLKNNQNDIGSQLIDVSSWNMPIDSDKETLLTKLHGCVKWRKRGNEIHYDPIDSVFNPNEPALIFPGFKGAPSRPHHLAFHTYLAEALKVASHVVFIGFAFRDEHLNNIFNQSLKNKNVAIIGLEDERMTLPNSIANNLSDFEYFGGGFNEKSVDAVLKWTGK